MNIIDYLFGTKKIRSIRQLIESDQNWDNFPGSLDEKVETYLWLMGTEKKQDKKPKSDILSDEELEAEMQEPEPRKKEHIIKIKKFW